MFKLDAIQLRKIRMLLVGALIPCVIGAALWTFWHRNDHERLMRNEDLHMSQMLNSYLDDAVFANAVEAINRAGALAVNSGHFVAEQDLASIVNSNWLLDEVFLLYSRHDIRLYPARSISVSDLEGLPWYADSGDTELRVYYSVGDALVRTPSLYMTRSQTLPSGERVLIGIAISTDMIRNAVARFADGSVAFGLKDMQGNVLLDGFYDAELTDAVHRIDATATASVGVYHQISTMRHSYSVYTVPSMRYPYQLQYAAENRVKLSYYVYEGFAVFVGLMGIVLFVGYFYVRISRSGDIERLQLSKELDDYFVAAGEQIVANRCEKIPTPPLRAELPSLTTFRELLIARLGDFNVQHQQLWSELKEMHDQIADMQTNLEAQKRRTSEQKKYINYLAFNDVLTRLPNRRYLRDRLSEIMNTESAGLLMMLDIDRFNAINDSKGHAYGDKVLVEVAKRLSVLEGKQVVVTRYGADEFALLYHDEFDGERLSNFVSIVTHTFDEPLRIDTDRVDIRCSIGIATFPGDAQTAEDLLTCANIAMQQVKNTKKNGYQYFDQQMAQEISRAQHILESLNIAIAGDGFDVVYQPLVHAGTRELYGFEALLRMRSGQYAPGEFIPVAESSGLIVPIGKFVTESVIRQLAAWKREYGVAKPVSINFSVKQMLDEDYQEFLFSKLRYYRVEPELIELEITENIFLDHHAKTIDMLTQFRDAGIKISIDDFGTGYSSLSYLTFVPLDKVKFDRSLIERYLNYGNDGVIDSLISLVHSLGLRVVSEGVETNLQYETIRDHGCDYIQGYYFSAPLTAAQAGRHMMRRDSEQRSFSAFLSTSVAPVASAPES